MKIRSNPEGSTPLEEVNTPSTARREVQPNPSITNNGYDQHDNSARHHQNVNTTWERVQSNVAKSKQRANQENREPPKGNDMKQHPKEQKIEAQGKDKTVGATSSSVQNEVYQMDAQEEVKPTNDGGFHDNLGYGTDDVGVIVVDDEEMQVHPVGHDDQPEWMMADMSKETVEPDDPFKNQDDRINSPDLYCFPDGAPSEGTWEASFTASTLDENNGQVTPVGAKEEEEEEKEQNDQETNDNHMADGTTSQI